METLSQLQQRLCLSEGDIKFEHAQLVEWTANFCRLFSINEEKKQATFIGTPTQLRALLDELLALARRCGINMETAVWGKYPNICPYCLTKPCSCGPRKTGPHKRLNIPLPQKGITLGNFQEILGEIYLNHTSLLQECVDIISEVAESSLAVWRPENPIEIKEEFADIFARLIRVANSLGIHLEGIIP